AAAMDGPCGRSRWRASSAQTALAARTLLAAAAGGKAPRLPACHGRLLCRLEDRVERPELVDVRGGWQRDQAEGEGVGGVGRDRRGERVVGEGQVEPREV